MDVKSKECRPVFLVGSKNCLILDENKYIVTIIMVVVVVVVVVVLVVVVVAVVVAGSNTVPYLQSERTRAAAKI